MATSGYTGPEVSKGLGYVTSHLSDAEDDYTRGIIANALVYAAPNSQATSEMLDELDGKKVVSGDMVYWNPGIPTAASTARAMI